MSEKMNVLFFITDQQRADHLGCAGNPILKTPNLDRLASEGVRFNSAYVANPVCMPNRCCIFTGLHANMCARAPGINLADDIPTFSETLHKAGYNTKCIGKMHIQYWAAQLKEGVHSHEFGQEWFDKKTFAKKSEDFLKSLPYYGFSEADITMGHGDVMTGFYRSWLEERAPQYLPIIAKLAKKVLFNLHYKSPLPEEYYPTSYITDRSIDFLERYSKGDLGEEPFFLFVSYPDPHHPVTPPGKWADMYNPEDIELPESFSDQDNVKEHKFFGKRLDHPLFRNMILRTTNEEETREFTARTYGVLSMIDNSVGQILASLDKMGLADNTIVIYTSDHGDMMGDHGLLLKGPLPFDGIYRIPMIWKVPGVAKPGSVTDSLISSVDFAPTILNLCNIDKKDQPPDMQGFDMTPVLEDPKMKIRDRCLIENDRATSEDPLGRLKTLVTEKYSLSVYAGIEDYGDLFDRKSDPMELNNLWFSNPELRHELVEKLMFEMLRTQSLYPEKEART